MRWCSQSSETLADVQIRVKISRFLLQRQQVKTGVEDRNGKVGDTDLRVFFRRQRVRPFLPSVFPLRPVRPPPL